MLKPTRVSQTSFFVRNILPGRKGSQVEGLRPWLSIYPLKAQFIGYSPDNIQVLQMTLKNDSKLPKKIIIVQPSKPFFSVKIQSNDLLAKDCVDVFVWFNPQKQRNNIQDEFIIKVNGGTSLQLHIAIICVPKMPITRQNSRLIISRDNMTSSLKRNSAMNNRVSLMIGKGQRSSSRLVNCSSNSIQNKGEIDTSTNICESFQNKFKQTLQYVREKLYKNEVYLGQAAMSVDKIQQFSRHLEQTMQMNQKKQRIIALNRILVEYSMQGPIGINSSSNKLTWNCGKNISKMTLKLGLSKIQEQVRKYVVGLRFQRIKNAVNIYTQYKNRQQSFGRKVRPDQYMLYLHSRLQENNKFKTYQFDFNKTSLRPTQLPSDFQTKIANISFQINQRIGFDNWMPMNSIKENNMQIYSLEEIDNPVYSLSLPSAGNDNTRGWLQEMPFKTPKQINIEDVINIVDKSIQTKPQISQLLKTQDFSNFYWQQPSQKQEEVQQKYLPSYVNTELIGVIKSQWSF